MNNVGSWLKGQLYISHLDNDLHNQTNNFKTSVFWSCLMKTLRFYSSFSLYFAAKLRSSKDIAFVWWETLNETINYKLPFANGKCTNVWKFSAICKSQDDFPLPPVLSKWDTVIWESENSHSFVYREQTTAHSVMPLTYSYILMRVLHHVLKKALCFTN